MKKMLVLALALVFMLSGAVMAQHTGGVLDPYEYVPGMENGTEWTEGDYVNYDADNGDGVVFVNDTDSDNPGEYTNLEEFNRDVTNYDRNTVDSPKQKVEIKLDVEAYIPCYLEMRLTGNQGTTHAISYGPNAEATGNANGYLMVFDNEIGGYLDANWQSLGHGSNVELDPGEEIFIGACDIFAVEVISNDAYRYEVESKALDGQGNASGEKLPMYMRSNIGGSWLGTDTVFTVAGNTFTQNRSAGIKLEALHNFKVPFSMDTVHGEYTGDIYFRAVTI
ncbi:hypothetical protein ACTWKD_11685 [Halanaerobium saccharolyticum]|uniref:hypothetical protein n=1 Tax=Halanaerobium saccharolyticum TaxID=43595 RepID=UPI003FCE488B